MNHKNIAILRTMLHIHASGSSSNYIWSCFIFHVYQSRYTYDSYFKRLLVWLSLLM